MTRDSTAFPIEDAEVFARSKGLDDTVTYMNGLGELYGWKGDLLGVKKGKYIMLFLACGLFEEFKQTHWPQEGASGSHHGKLVDIALALAYDEAARMMKKEASSKRPPVETDQGSMGNSASRDATADDHGEELQVKGIAEGVYLVR